MNNTTTAPGAYNPYVPLVARLLMAAIFVVFGARKLLAFAGTAGYFTKLGFPMPEVMVVLAIVIELGGGILLAIGWRRRWVAWFLAGFVVIATAMGHRFWEADPARLFGEMNNFLKNLAIVGGLLIFAARDKA